MYRILYITGGYYIRVPYINRCLFFNRIEADKNLKHWFEVGGYNFLPYYDAQSINEGIKINKYCHLIYFSNAQFDEFSIERVPDV